MKSTIKNRWYLAGLSILVSLMASCLGNNGNDDIISITDAEIIGFGLSNDSMPDLVKVNFSIDQRGDSGLIYNYDSMAYQTEIRDSVIIFYQSGAGTDNVLNITGGDSIWVKSGDSISVSQPLIFKVYALDGKTTKLYKFQLNIHQVDPDSIQYFPVASDLPFLHAEDTKAVVFNNRFLVYSKIENEIRLSGSSDAINWTPDIVSGLPPNTMIKGIRSVADKLFAITDDGKLYVRYDLTDDQWIPVNTPGSIKIKSILGYISAGPKQPEGLSVVVETAGIHTFAFTNDLIHWEYDSISPTPIPDNFPLYDFSSYSYQLMLTGRITVFGGVSSNGEVLNTVWSTENGRYWAKLNGAIKVFPPLEGANVFYYNKEFWLINGKSGIDYNRDIYYSIDGGVTWQIKPEKCRLPDDFPDRYGASLVTDKDNKHFYIIGGKQETILTDVWKGVLNKMEFEH